MSHRFDAQTTIETIGDNVYRATLTDEWNIGRVPNGGYQAAVSCRAALSALGTTDAINATSYFIRPTAAGPVELRVEVIKRGRTTSLAQVCLVQEGRERVRSLVLGGDLDSLEGPELHRTSAPALPPPEDCPRMSARAPVAPKLMDEIELRFHPDTSAFMRGETGEAPELVAWLRFADGREPDALALTCFADVLPPTTFNHLGITGWVPTLELTTQIRRRPAPGWLRTRMVTRHISAGHFEEDGELWDSEDELVAVSRQRAMLVAKR